MMAVPSRDIPLPLIRTQVEHRMREALTDRLGDSIPPHTLEALDQIGKAISSKCFASLLDSAPLDFATFLYL